MSILNKAVAGSSSSLRQLDPSEIDQVGGAGTSGPIKCIYTEESCDAQGHCSSNSVEKIDGYVQDPNG